MPQPVRQEKISYASRLERFLIPVSKNAPEKRLLPNALENQAFGERKLYSHSMVPLGLGVKS